MDQYLSFLDYVFLGNTVLVYLRAVFFFFSFLFLFFLFRKLIVKNIAVFAKRSKTLFDDKLVAFFNRIPFIFYFVLSLYFTLFFVDVSAGFRFLFNSVFLVVIVCYSIFFIQSFVEYLLTSMFLKRGRGDAKRSATTVFGIMVLVKLLLWSVGGLLVLSNFGIDVTSLIAGLGVGGIAIALAVQNVLGDIFSSFSIYFDRPFEVGDFIIIGSDQGTVKKIGLKSTRIETLGGEELVVSNKELTSTRVQNFKRMKRRRVSVSLHFVYDTSTTALKKVKALVEKVVSSVDGVEFSRCHFIDFGEYSLVFEVVYFIDSAEYDFFLDRKEQINFALRDVFEKNKIEMAFPTQHVILSKD